jgi:serine-type D-Ala-D-Ala carboxypeptidase/endopeptidase (penicillin-binding protein 4)
MVTAQSSRLNLPTLLISLVFVVSLDAQTLEQRLRPFVNEGIAQRSTTSIKIVDLESGRVVAAQNPDTPIVPASNLKLFTTAAGLDILGGDFKFETTLSILGEISPNGILEGDVRISGGGDPAMAARFYDGRSTVPLENFIHAMKQEGIRSISGNVVIEYGYFDDEWVHPTWPEDQLVYWYEAPISSPTIQEGCVIVRVKPGNPGGSAIVELEPPNSFMTVENTAVTQRAGRGVYVGRRAGTNRIIVRGNVRPGDGPTEIPVTVQYPVHYFGNVFHRLLESEGIHLQGQPILTRRDPRTGWRVIARHATPLPVVINVINKVSQNHYAEQLLKVLGAESSGSGSWESGAGVIERWAIERAGVPAGQLRMVDGSGMSRENLASASAFIKVLEYMWTSEDRIVFVTSMPYSGEPASRLRRRMNRPAHARNVYAKTGYLSGAVGLSGYVRGSSGRIYGFSLLFNRFPTHAGAMYQLQNTILETVIDHG